MNYPDIYFEPAYAKLYETEDAEAVEYRFQCVHGTVTNLFLKRRIPTELTGGETYFDIATPYGYGGPLLHDVSDKERLIAAYMEDFASYTGANGIVSEFVRFHPIVGNGVDFREAYHSCFDRKTVGTNLTYEDVIATEFSKHKRKDIRKLLKNPEIRYAIDEHPGSLDDFMEIYYSTMERDGADSYYFFDRSYFEKMRKAFPENLLTCKVFLADKCIAMGVYFSYGRYLHAHLSGTLSEYMSYSPAYILKYALAVYGHEHGYEVIHYGGGSSTSPENGLYKFKKEFGRTTDFDFYLAKKIWNEAIYRELCEAAGNPQGTVLSDDGFFPAYRRER